MIRPKTSALDAPFIVIDIGNTHTGVATWQVGSLRAPLSVGTRDEPAFVEALTSHIQASRPAAVVISSVVPDAVAVVREHVQALIQKDAHVVGQTLPLPLDVDVTDPTAIGVDRVCAAAAVYERLQTGCTVIDLGTAVTVDLVDDEGTLVGGAILPGIRMQLQALHEYTAQLPEVEPGFPERPYGRNTIEAIQTGVCRGLAGAVRGLVEGYATWLNRWPQVVATGGDAEFLLPHCDFIDTFASHLTLQGVALAYTKHLIAGGA